MLGEAGNFLLFMALGFSLAQVLASFWGVWRSSPRYLALGKAVSLLQGGFLAAAFLTLLIAFYICDFSLSTVVMHDNTQLPWIYRLTAAWGNHEGSLLLFVLVLSSLSVAMAFCLKEPGFRGRALTIQGGLTFLFLLFLLITSNPFKPFPFPVTEGLSLNPLLQDRGLWIHPPLLYLGYVGFSAPYSLAIAALWGRDSQETWMPVARPWALLAWAALTGGITLGSWWAYYELGWGGWWFWDPVENASLMPWLSGTALLHSLASKKFYRTRLFLSLLTFALSLLGTFLVRSGLITSVHSFASDPDRGVFILTLLGLIMGFGFFMWIWRAPKQKGPALAFLSRKGFLLFNIIFLLFGLGVLILGTLYPLLSDLMGFKKVSVGAPYFERTLIPLMLPMFLLIPIGAILRHKKEPLFPLLLLPLTATLGVSFLFLTLVAPHSLWAIAGTITALWVIGGTLQAAFKKRLRIGGTLAHLGVGMSLLGVSIGGGLREDVTLSLKPSESFEVGNTGFTLKNVKMGEKDNYLYERATLTHPGGNLHPEKRLYKPQNSLLSETAIYTNGLKDIYMILGPYQGENRWTIRASLIPLAPWIWIGGAFMVFGALFSIFRRKELACLLLFFSTPALASESLDTQASRIAQEIRCPVCIGQPLSESDTPESQELKAFILDGLKAGQSEEEIREKVRKLYGDEILFRPPFEGHSLFLWLAPFAFFLLLIGFISWRFWVSNNS